MRKSGDIIALLYHTTGVGKTYIAAFDLKAYDKILFVAHREGILLQAEQTFKNVRSDIKTGFFMGTKKDLNVDVLFATVQTIGQDRYLKDKYSNKRALAFCASRSHAVYMAQYFCGHGVAACPVVSGKHSEYCMDRREAISKLNRCDIDIIFAVDIFNEGVDIPALDLIMFLWPTESSTVILQQ